MIRMTIAKGKVEIWEVEIGTKSGHVIKLFVTGEEPAWPEPGRALKLEGFVEFGRVKGLPVLQRTVSVEVPGDCIEFLSVEDIQEE